MEWDFDEQPLEQEGEESLGIRPSLVFIECENEGSTFETARVIAKTKVAVTFGPPCTLVIIKILNRNILFT